MAGMEESDIIIAINKDESAPIFDVADYGVVGDLNKIVPVLTQKIKEGGYEGTAEDQRGKSSSWQIRAKLKHKI